MAAATGRARAYRPRAVTPPRNRVDAACRADDDVRFPGRWVPAHPKDGCWRCADWRATLLDVYDRHMAAERINIDLFQLAAPCRAGVRPEAAARRRRGEPETRRGRRDADARSRNIHVAAAASPRTRLDGVDAPPARRSIRVIVLRRDFARSVQSHEVWDGSPRGHAMMLATNLAGIARDAARMAPGAWKVLWYPAERNSASRLLAATLV